MFDKRYDERGGELQPDRVVGSAPVPEVRERHDPGEALPGTLPTADRVREKQSRRPVADGTFRKAEDP
jgi:hypothetical protein